MRILYLFWSNEGYKVYIYSSPSSLTKFIILSINESENRKQRPREMKAFYKKFESSDECKNRYEEVPHLLTKYEG